MCADCDRIRTGIVVREDCRKSNSQTVSSGTCQEKVLLQCNSWLGQHHPFYPNNLKKLASLLLKDSHRDSRKVRNHLYRANLRNGRKTSQFCQGMCFFFKTNF